MSGDRSTLMTLMHARPPAFLLNHSPQYHIALAASVVEYAAELYFLPSIKECAPLFSHFFFSFFFTGVCL